MYSLYLNRITWFFWRVDRYNFSFTDFRALLAAANFDFRALLARLAEMRLEFILEV